VILCISLTAFEHLFEHLFVSVLESRCMIQKVVIVEGLFLSMFHTEFFRQCWIWKDSEACIRIFLEYMYFSLLKLL